MGKKILFSLVIAICSCTQNYNNSDNANKDEISDFDAVCEIARSFDWSEFPDKQKARLQFAYRVKRALPDSFVSETVVTYAEQIVKDSRDQYQMFIELAKETGLTNYDCITLKDHF